MVVEKETRHTNRGHALVGRIETPLHFRFIVPTFTMTSESSPVATMPDQSAQSSTEAEPVPAKAKPRGLVAWTGILEFPDDKIRNPEPTDRPFFPATALTTQEDQKTCQPIFCQRHTDATSFPKKMVAKLGKGQAILVYWIHEEGTPEHGAFYWAANNQELIRIQFTNLDNDFANGTKIQMDLKICLPVPQWNPPERLFLSWPNGSGSSVLQISNQDERSIDFGTVWATTALSFAFRYRSSRFGWVLDGTLDLALARRWFSQIVITVIRNGQVDVLTHSSMCFKPVEIPCADIESVALIVNERNEHSINLFMRDGTTYRLNGSFNSQQMIVAHFVLGVWDDLPIGTFVWKADQKAWVRETPLGWSRPLQHIELPHFIAAIGRSLDDKHAGALFQYDPESGHSIHLHPDGTFTVMQCKSMKHLLRDSQTLAWNPSTTTAFIDTSGKEARLCLERSVTDPDSGERGCRIFDLHEVIRYLQNNLLHDTLNPRPKIAKFLHRCLFSVSQRLLVTYVSLANNRIFFRFPLWALIRNDSKKYRVFSVLAESGSEDEVSVTFYCAYRPSIARHPLHAIRKCLTKCAKIVKVDDDPDVKLMIQRLTVDDTLCWNMWLAETANSGKVTWCPNGSDLVSTDSGRKLPMAFVQNDPNVTSGRLYMLRTNASENLCWCSVKVPESVANEVHHRAIEMLPTRGRIDQYDYRLCSNVPLKCLRRSENALGGSDFWVYRTRGGKDHGLKVHY